jgi:hypothetical protein
VQESFTKLRELKGEIESIQRLLEKARTKLQQEFDDWCVLGANHGLAEKNVSLTDLVSLRMAQDRAYDTRPFVEAAIITAVLLTSYDLKNLERSLLCM